MKSGKWVSVLGVAFLGLVTMLVLNFPIAAQSLEPPQSAQVEIPAATVRTVPEMLRDQAANPRPTAPGGPVAVPFLPTIDPADYAAAKLAAAAAAPAGVPRPALPQEPASPLVLGDINCDGIDQPTAGGPFGTSFPPDTDGAVGVSQFVQVTNTHVTVWDKTPFPGTTCPAPLFPQLDVDLNTFMGYFNQKVFDPRVIHDDVLNRWVITAEAFPEAPAVQFQFVAVSRTEDATDGYFIFPINVRTLPSVDGAFWDFPQVGMDEDTIILTANLFNPKFVGDRTVFLEKLRMYNGLPGLGCIFSGGVLDKGTWAPPKVLDLNPATFTVSAPLNDNALLLLGFTATDRICPIVLSVNSIPVPAYTVPPNAAQPGTPQVLHTSDGRFQNRSTQIGNALWQVHTEQIGPRPTPKFFNINTATKIIDQQGFFSASGTSFDFNPSIVANFANTAAVTWSSTDPSVGANADVRVSAKALPAANFGAGVRVFLSPGPLLDNFDPNLNAQRWGDYSSIVIDPTDPNVAWGVNETICAADPWCTQFFNAGIP